MDLLTNKITIEIFSKLEQQWLSSQSRNNDINKTKILSIDGGHTSAVIAATFLVYLEEQIQAKTNDSSARIVDFFDIVSGTGIGAILAVLITAVNSDGRPLFSARDAVKFLAENRESMFKLRRGGVFRRRKDRHFSGESLAKVLQQALKNKTLKDTCKPILVPCYDTVTSAPFVFSRAAASASDFELWKVCAAAVASPANFSPVEITSVDGKTSLKAVDGGIVMNNPAVTAVTHVLHNKEDFPTVKGVEDLIVLSLGNGSMSRGSSEKWSGGSKKTVESVVEVAVDGVSEMVDQMLGNAFAWNRLDYLRIQANGLEGTTGLMTMEKALKERGIESLAFGGKRLLTETNGDRIESFARRLIAASTKSSLPSSPFKSLSPALDGR